MKAREKFLWWITSAADDVQNSPEDMWNAAISVVKWETLGIDNAGSRFGRQLAYITNEIGFHCFISLCIGA